MVLATEARAAAYTGIDDLRSRRLHSTVKKDGGSPGGLLSGKRCGFFITGSIAFQQAIIFGFDQLVAWA